MTQILTDQFGRNHNYLRISLLERCNLRCHYCMPEEGIPLRDKKEFMSQEELFEIVQTFVRLGINKIRLTGGEPLIKKNFAEILSFLTQQNVDLNITTNGILLDQYWDELEAAKIETLNISLDSLIEEKFNKISRRSFFSRIYQNIFTAIEKGFKVKLNVVLIKDENDDEIIDFIDLTRDHDLNVRFIEFMPFDGNNWDRSKTVSEKSILETVKEEYPNRLSNLESGPNSTSHNYKIDGFKGTFGIISTVTNPFCDGCNRLRLTADGKIKNCLFSNNETDLLSALRRKENIIPFIEQAVSSKKKKLAGISSFDIDEKIKNRSMTTIGG
jgi:GTP 3',8-cyclase